MKSPAALSCLQMGFSDTIVREAIMEYSTEHKHSNFNGVEIAEICDKLTNRDNVEISGSEIDETGDIDDLVEENRQLKDIFLCKICLQNQVTVVFVDCGHMASCGQCAPAFSICPICRVPVQGFVKAVFV